MQASLLTEMYEATVLYVQWIAMMFFQTPQVEMENYCLTLVSGGNPSGKNPHVVHGLWFRMVHGKTSDVQ